MRKLTMHWQLGNESDPAAHFFLYEDDEEVHCDHRLYSREELERRIAGIRNSNGEVPTYYQEALAALDDPQAPRSGRIPLGTDR